MMPAGTGSIARVVLSGFGGLLLTLAVFDAMRWLVSRESNVQGASEPSPAMEFVRLKHEPRTQLKERLPPDEPDELQPLPEIPRLDLQAPAPTVPNPAIPVTAPRVPLAFAGPVLGAVTAANSRELMIIARTPPRYPYRAERQGIEGWVRLSLLVTETGTVRDVVVLESDPPDVFDQAAVQAAYKWRFQPRLVDGKPVETRATQTFRFDLDS